MREATPPPPHTHTNTQRHTQNRNTLQATQNVNKLDLDTAEQDGKHSNLGARARTCPMFNSQSTSYQFRWDTEFTWGKEKLTKTLL
jgi:hypothetical protein